MQYPQNGAAIPVRYMIPTGHRQVSPPFANQAFDRFSGMQAPPRAPQYMGQPVRYPPGYPQPRPNMMPNGTSPYGQTEQLQPPAPYYYNPYGPNGASPTPSTESARKGAKEYKDTAFTITPDGKQSEAIKGLVSNNDINDLLKHKGTKIKVSKIYRITKSKPEVQIEESSDEELLPPPPAPVEKPRSQPVERPISASSSDSHCSTCSNCSCSDCRRRSRSHIYDDCPECQAELAREEARRRRRRK